MAREIYLVRSGDYEGRDGAQRLTDRGREQAASARDALLQKGLQERSILMASMARGAVQTAEIINEALNVRLVLSSWLEKGGINPWRIPDLDAFLEEELADEDVTLGDNSLVVVTHGPLIAVAKGLTTMESQSGVAQGEVYQYQAGTWKQPRPGI